MDDVFDNTFSEQEQGKGETQQPAQQPQQAEGQQPAGEQQPQQPGEQGAVPPAAGEQGKHVPLEALEAVRGERRDWKEKAIKAEAERDLLRQQWERAQQPPGQQQPQDPLLTLQQQIVNERFNTSELLVREKYPDTDEVIATFKEAAARNPALAAQMHASPHPWKFAYDEGKRLKFAAEIGTDPEAYRKKVRAEVEAELRGQGAPTPGQSAAPATPAIPQSLAGARSAGGRGDTFTGPTPMENLFPN